MKNYNLLFTSVIAVILKLKRSVKVTPLFPRKKKEKHWSALYLYRNTPEKKT